MDGELGLEGKAACGWWKTSPCRVSFDAPCFLRVLARGRAPPEQVFLQPRTLGSAHGLPARFPGCCPLSLYTEQVPFAH